MLNEIFARAYVAILSLARDEEGASAVEYGLILGLIAIVIIVVLGTIGTELDVKYDAVCAAIKGGAC